MIAHGVLNITDNSSILLNLNMLFQQRYAGHIYKVQYLVEAVLLPE